MKFGDWIMIAAILCGPVLAVQAQKWIETAREKRNRRLNVFKRLMATRGAVLSPGHVEALNMIDLEFAGRGRRNEQVRRRWREYLVLRSPRQLNPRPRGTSKKLACMDGA